MTTRVIRQLFMCLLCLAAGQVAVLAQTATVLYQFDGVTSGRPLSGLVEGTDGRLYGTTIGDGTAGTIYRIGRDGSGFDVLHTFGDGTVSNDGANPGWGTVAVDADGVLYGTTINGGEFGNGVLYRLDPRAAAPVLEILHAFDGPSANPEAGVVVGSDGWLYGTTGAVEAVPGTVYRIARDGAGFTVLHTFTGPDGSNPRGTLIEGSDGALYGTTRVGGSFAAGTVFRINRDGTGFQSLVDLDGYPVVGVTEAAGPDGTPHLFGVEFSGADPSRAFGSIFRLRRDGSDFARIGTFYGADRDGGHPMSPLLRGRDGQLYGTAYDWQAGCTPSGCGAVFRVGEQDQRPWGIHLFTVANGGHPSGALVQGSDGAIYGTTVNGGTITAGAPIGEGVIFRISEPGATPLVFTAPATVVEGDPITYSLSLRNTNGVILREGTISLTWSDGLQFVSGSSDGWWCQVSGSTGLCQWLTDLAPGAQSDVHTLTFTALPPYAADCGASPSPCVTAEARLQYTGARVAVSTPVSIYVDGFLNRPPVAADDSAGASGTQPVRIRVLNNDTDVDGDALTLAGIVTPPRLGVATINGDGTITYTAAATLTVTDSFRYRISDGRGASATALVTVSPLAVAPLEPLNPLVDIGPVALGDVAAGRTWVLAQTALRGNVTFEALSQSEIATALAGTGFDATRAASSPAAFRASDWLTLDTPRYGQSGMVMLYYRAGGAVGDVAVVRAVMTADVAGANPPTTSVIVVATTAEPTLAPQRAIADVATSNVPGAAVTVDVLANDVRQSTATGDYVVMVAACPDFAAYLFDNGLCDTGVTGAIAFPAMFAPEQNVTFTPYAAETGTAQFSYGFAAPEACASDPVCLPIKTVYFAPVSVIYRDGRPVDLGLTLAVTPASVDAGQPVTVTATITNHSTTAAGGVTLHGLAAMTSFAGLSLSASQGQCLPAVVGQPLSCTLGSISPFESATVVLTGVPSEALLPAGQSSRRLALVAQVVGSDPDPVVANDSASTTVTVTAVQRPHVQFTALQFENLAGQVVTSAQVGETVRYRIAVRNTTTTAATLSMATTLPFGMSLVTGSSNWPCSVVGDTVTCTAAVAGFDSVANTFLVVVGPATVPAGQASIAVTASSTITATGDTDSTGHVGSASLTVVPRVVQADLSVQVTASPAAVAVGASTTLTVTVRNAGPDAATAVRLTAFDFLSGFHYVGLTLPQGWSCQPLVDDQPLSCQVAELAAGTTAVFAVTASPTTSVFAGTSGSPSIPVNATVSASEADPRGTDNVGATTVTVPRPPATLTVTATVSPVAAAIDADAVYDIELHNPGVTDATGVTVVIDLPPEIAVRGLLPPQPPLSSCSFSPALSPAGTPDVTITCQLRMAAGATGHFRLDGRLRSAPTGGVATFPVIAASNDCVDVSPTLAGTQCAVTTGSVVQAVTTLQAQLIQDLPAAATAARVGDPVTYRARLTNTGTLPARATVTSLQLPPELGIRAGTAPIFNIGLSGCNYPLTLVVPGPVINCQLPPLAAGAVVEMVVQAEVLAVPALPVAPLVFRVGSQDCVDVSPVAGSQCDSVAAGTLIARATFSSGLTFERAAGTSPTAPIRLGDALIARATVTNTSAIDARNPRVRLTFPATLGVTTLRQQPPLSGATFTPPLSRGLLGTPAVTIDFVLPTIVAGGSATMVVDLRALGIPANGLYEATLDVGSRDCHDLVAGGQVICDQVTGSIAATPGSTGSIGLGVTGLGLSTSGGLFRSIEGLPATEVPPPPAGVMFPYGAMAFEVYDVPVGGSITIAITAPNPVTGYWKLAGGTWSRFTGGLPIQGGLLLTLTDGGAGDADGRANGVIVDPGALGVAVGPPTSAAGADLVAEATSPAGALVTLAGNGSDPAGGPLAFAWSGACGTATMATVTLTCPLGTSTMTLTVTNGAGLTASDEVQIVVRDTTSPSVALTAPVDGAVYILNQAVTASYACADAGTGVASCLGTVADGSSLGTSAPGTRTLTVTATDAVGNSVTVTRQYTVIFASGGPCLQADGHATLPPIDAGGSSVFPRGLPVLARFRVCDANGRSIGVPGIVTGFRVVRATSGGVAQPLDAPVPSLLKPAMFQWERLTKSWVFAIDTRRLASRTTTYDLVIALSDGSTIPFRFTVRAGRESEH